MSNSAVSQFGNVPAGFCRWGCGASTTTPAAARQPLEDGRRPAPTGTVQRPPHFCQGDGPLSASPPVQKIGVVLGGAEQGQGGLAPAPAVADMLLGQGADRVAAG